MAHFALSALVAAAAPLAAAISSHSHAMLATVDVSALASSTLLPAASGTAPEQLHLSLTGSPSEMFCTFVLPNVTTPCTDAAVTLTGGASFPSTHLTYTAGVIGW